MLQIFVYERMLEERVYPSKPKQNDRNNIYPTGQGAGRGIRTHAHLYTSRDIRTRARVCVSDQYWRTCSKRGIKITY
jgi:hypothetical protein